MQLAVQYQLLFPQAVPISPPVESKNSAICSALRVLVPRISISIVRFPRPLVFSSSSLTPPRLYMFITTVGEVAMCFTSRIVPLGNSTRSTAEAIVGWVVEGCDAGLIGRSKSSALGNPCEPVHSEGNIAEVINFPVSRY